MTTFKVNKTDIDFATVCNDLSEPESKYLAIKHVTSKRKHVHVYIENSVEELPKKLKLYNQEHKEPGDRQGPWKLSNKTIDPDFVNYMCKEPQWSDNIEANRGFDYEELEQAHEASEAYRDKLKNGLRSYFAANFPTFDEPEGLHRKLKLMAIDYYRQEERCMPPQIKSMILSYMTQLAPTPSVDLYVANII